MINFDELPEKSKFYCPDLKLGYIDKKSMLLSCDWGRYNIFTAIPIQGQEEYVQGEQVTVLSIMDAMDRVCGIRR